MIWQACICPLILTNAVISWGGHRFPVHSPLPCQGCPGMMLQKPPLSPTQAKQEVITYDRSLSGVRLSTIIRNRKDREI